ncbi:MAG TPA: Gfo/Idh/MocA family oxidoreductase, partial [Thermoleophilia bacterium]|nr:Gfo/Idh/MocA family oxidoreductase [Thermoleophilia bacterium]
LGFRANGTLMHGGIPHLLYECRERDRPRSGLTRKDQPLPTESLDRPIGLGMIGAGRYLHDFLAPGLRQQLEKGAVRPTGVVTLRQESASKAASSFGFQFAATGDEGIARLLNDPQTEAVVIATRHDTHAELAAAALRAGRHVLVEKPLALTEPELEGVQSALAQTRRPLQLRTGFNRRFAPLAGPLARALRGRSGPFQLSIVVNARPLPPGHWRTDRSQGGRLLGHAVHFIDLARFLVDSPFEWVEAEGLAGNPENLLIRMAFADRSRTVVHYCPTGDPGVLGEQLWVAGGGLTAWVNNWAALEIRADGETLSQSLSAPDKGFRAQLESFLEAVRYGSPIDVMRADEQFEVARHAIRAADGLKV